MPCFSICSLTHPFTCLLPVPLCSKATGAPLCFGTHASPAPKRLALLAIATRATQQPSPTTLLVLLPHHRAALPSCLFLGFSFYNLPPARVGGGFFIPFFSLSVPLSCGKAQHMPQSRVCWRKTSVLIYYMNIWLSPHLPRLLKMVHFTVVTLHS